MIDERVTIFPLNVGEKHAAVQLCGLSLTEHKKRKEREKMKILATTPIPTQDLFALRNELTMLSEHVEKLLRYSFVEDPKPEASPDPKAEPSAVPETRSKRRQV